MALFTSLTLLVILKIIASSTSEETCEKIDTCSCKFKNGSKVNLWPEDGGQKPRFTLIPEDGGRTFDWNPCTPFSITSGCSNVMSCQILSEKNFPAGTKDSTFSVDSEGNVVITYGASSGDSGHTRQTEITLICDPTKNGTKPKGFTGKESASSTLYTGTFNSKFACATGGSSGLSVGSILLIIFFPLLLMYVIIGVLVNHFGRGIKSMPELLPNHSFWADFPFLVKDGAVFTYDRIKTGICGKCGKGGYSEI